MSRLETLVMHAFAGVTLVDASDGQTLTLAVKAQWHWDPEQGPGRRRWLQKAQGFAILDWGPEAATSRGLDGQAGVSASQRPSDSPLALAGLLEAPGIIPRRFQLSLDPAASEPSRLACYRHPASIQPGAAGALIGSLCRATAEEPSRWPAAAWALVELEISASDTRRAQAADNGELVLPLQGLDRPVAGAPPAQATLRVRAPALPWPTGPIDPDHDLVPWRLASAGDGVAVSADAPQLNIPLHPGRITRLVSPSFRALVLTTPA